MEQEQSVVLTKKQHDKLEQIRIAVCMYCNPNVDRHCPHIDEFKNEDFGYDTRKLIDEYCNDCRLGKELWCGGE